MNNCHKQVVTNVKNINKMSELYYCRVYAGYAMLDKPKKCVLKWSMMKKNQGVEKDNVKSPVVIEHMWSV